MIEIRARNTPSVRASRLRLLSGLLVFGLIGALACGHLAACGQADSASSPRPTSLDEPDSGVLDADASAPDAWAPDASAPDVWASDASAPDAWASDASTPDALPDFDSGSSPNDRTLRVTAPCTDALSDVYATPADAASKPLGSILRCAQDPAWSLSADVLSSALKEPATSGLEAYRLSYRTSRNYDNPVGIAGTARLLVPTTPADLGTPLPIVVINHGTVGLADGCAPSLRDPHLEADLNSATLLALSLAAQGLAVIAPDYAGMGNEGVQGYGDGIDTAFSVLDAARALTLAFDTAEISNRVLMTGHSQGGGATFEAVALAATYAPEFEVVAAGIFSGRYRSGDSSAARINPARPLGSGGFATVLSSYAKAANTVQESEALAIFAASHRAALSTLITRRCVSQLNDWLEPRALTFGGLFDEAFIADYNACVMGAATCSGVSRAMTEARPTHQPLTADSAQILMVVGDADELNSPEEVACTYAQAHADGSALQLCVDATATHASIVPSRHAFVRRWLLAQLAGDAALSCPADMHTGPTSTCGP
ncbi:MAG: alpha/beta fold hydrolase [Deltaproteobacteria bacterium]|nr:alpha/beta fold hydrolase [Deltaproteobacteria bacterium]